MANAAHETKTVSITVNGRPHTVPKGKLTYDDLVRLAFGAPQPNTRYTITYPLGKSDQLGKVAPGGSVEVRDGMSFDVDPTIES